MNSSSASSQPPRLLQQVRDHLRTLHYSYRTENAYVDEIRRYIPFHGKHHPRDMGKAEPAKPNVYRADVGAVNVGLHFIQPDLPC